MLCYYTYTVLPTHLHSMCGGTSPWGKNNSRRADWLKMLINSLPAEGAFGATEIAFFLCKQSSAALMNTALSSIVGNIKWHRTFVKTVSSFQRCFYIKPPVPSFDFEKCSQSQSLLDTLFVVVSVGLFVASATISMYEKLYCYTFIFSYVTYFFVSLCLVSY